ncbi:coiled-coil domain-containing protein 138-like isoform X2 [Ictalurus furcatus]|uniref:coiled-coil domain-containing protein 138-like isoform X2 n=1 Tax=Ictalurus furcatus TaxID=66913 RepID=UPI0023508750|nr:coiled-coil domain-containing protein 138-like isoform X2 [Ictalurus furcatus]
MSSEFSGSDLDIKVEILKRKYLERRNRVSVTEGAEVSEKCGGAVEKPKCCAVRGREEVTSRRELKSYSRALEELFQAVSDPPAGLERDESVLSSEDELSDQTDVLDRTNILCTETDVTLPSSVACTSSSLETEPARFSGGEGLRSQVPVEQVYQEMIEIYERLQVRAAELCERECELQRREKLLLKHQSTVNRLLTVEEDVLDRMNAMQQEHQQEMENLRAALREKTKENKRIKSSFDSIKELNDTMKKQLSEVSEQNTRLESQSRKVQARLENLQRKHEHSVSQRVRENVVLKSRDLKPSNQDKPPPPNKASKSSSSSSALKLLWYLMDWMVDGPPFSSEDVKTEREFDPFEVPRPSLPERCAKVLPVLLEQFQQAEAFLHSPLLRFIYCALTQLEHSTQHLPLTSTLRRLGEEVNRKSPPLFRSSCPHTRFLSSIIVLKTLSQDILAQALDVLNGIVGEDEGRGLFLKYKALTAILAVLRTGSPGLLAPSLDVLLHMSTESRHLPAFLEACSTDQFFRCAAVLLRNPRLDLTVAEKLSVLLQKLSCIRKNRRLFEASSLHLLLQEAQCSADPSRAFLNINFSSILFNLGVASRS